MEDIGVLWRTIRVLVHWNSMDVMLSAPHGMQKGLSNFRP